MRLALLIMVERDGALDYVLRPALAGEAAAIKALVREAGINPFGLDWPRFLVAVDGAGKILGCAQVKTHGDSSHELASLVVTPARRGQGIAAALVGEQQARHGAPLWLTCMDKLVPFYERCGFEQVISAGEMPGYFRRAARFFNLYLALTRGRGRLAVMVWRGV